MRSMLAAGCHTAMESNKSASEFYLGVLSLFGLSCSGGKAMRPLYCDRYMLGAFKPNEKRMTLIVDMPDKHPVTSQVRHSQYGEGTSLEEAAQIGLPRP